MSQSENFIRTEKTKINLEYLHSENIYAHDSLFFKEIQANESWSFISNHELTETSLSFIFMRSILAKTLHHSKIQATDLSQSAKAKIGKLGLADLFNQFLDASPLLGIPSKVELPTSIATLFLEDQHFHIKAEEKRESIFTGGGILKEKKTNAHEMVELLFTEFSLRNKTGHFFLRTKVNSYLYLLNPEIKSKTFYVQQKNSFPIDFQFYHIKIKE